MCRLLGVVTRAAAPLAATLAGDLEPFSALSAVHCDGWGRAAWTGGVLDVIKSPEAAESSAAFWSSTDTPLTDAGMLHLRNASAGMDSTPANTHPFRTADVAFAHNGFFATFPDLSARLPDADVWAPLGDTDSEHYFGMVLAASATTDAADALCGVAARITADSPEVVSLNALMLTPDSLIALACWNDAIPASPEAGAATYELWLRRQKNAITIASDGWQSHPEDWQRLPNRTLVRIDRGTLEITIRPM